MGTFAQIGVTPGGVSYVTEIYVESAVPIGQLFPPSITWVDVTDVIPQPEEGWTYANGVFTAPPPPAPPTPAQQAAAALMAGCQMVSTGTPSLNATYAVDPFTTNKAASISLYIQVNGKFPAGLSELVWPDIEGNPITFANTAQFQQAASAWADYVTLLDLYGNGISQSLPSQPVTIP